MVGFVLQKMAENSVKMKNAKKFGKRRQLIRFPAKALHSWLSKDSRAQEVAERVRFGQQLWRAIGGDSDSEDAPNDFVGFDQSLPDSVDSDVTTETTVCDKNRIQELLRSQWEDRIRALAARPDRPAPTPPALNASPAAKTKSILRKARLKINNRTIEKIRSAHRRDDDRKSAKRRDAPEVPKPAGSAKSGQPGFITCAICAQTKYYSHVQRRYGVFSCEPCSKFFARFLKDPKQYFCAQSGDCPIGDPSWRAASARCRGCWLKVCLQKFRIDCDVRQEVQKHFAPKLMTRPNVALLTVDTGANSSAKVDAIPRASLLMVAQSSSHRSSSGPRVKRVCRSAGTASGLPRATFPSDSETSGDSDALPVDVYLCRAFAKQSPETCLHSHCLHNCRHKKSALAVA